MKARNRKLILLTLGCFLILALQASGRQEMKRPALKPGKGRQTGLTVYQKNCLTCHQADGGGVQNMNPPLFGTSYINDDAGKMTGVVLNGFNEPADIDGQPYNNPMPSFTKLSDHEIALVLSYVRTHFGNHYGTVDSLDVARIRAENAQKKSVH